MSRFRKTLSVFAVLAIAACSDTSVAPRAPMAKGPVNLTTYNSLSEEIDGIIATLFPNKGLVTAADERWDNVKADLAANRIDGARKKLTNLSAWIAQKAMADRKNEAARLVLDMALYVYNGPLTPVPGGSASTIQTAFGVVEPTTELTLTTTHLNGGVGDGGI